jgi:hypothetical protein
MSIPPEVRDRIRDGLETAPDTAEIDFAKGTHYVCRKCGETTMKYQKTPAGAALLPTDKYAEVRVLFDDGSANVMGLCKSCAGGLAKEDLEWLYCIDLKRWNELGPVNWDIHGWRVPVDFQRET